MSSEHVQLVVISQRMGSLNGCHSYKITVPIGMGTTIVQGPACLVLYLNGVQDFVEIDSCRHKHRQRGGLRRFTRKNDNRVLGRDLDCKNDDVLGPR